MEPFNSISVVIPVYNSRRTLPAVLAALACARPQPLEVIIVDDGSTDDSAAIGEQAGCRVIRLERNSGAAVAKNRGAQSAQGDILFFTDSDIRIPDNLFSGVCQALADQAVDGAVGILSDETPARNYASQYKNLWMRYTYSRLCGLSRVGLFYTSAAAMRRPAFLAAGGFDENYRGASIAEDTEFGQRAWGRGLVIRLDPELAVVHLKVYSLLSLLREDVRRARALMLMRLRKLGRPFFTSVPLSFQLGVLSTYFAVLALGLAPFRPIPAAAAAAFGIAGSWALNAGWFVFLARARGLSFALIAALLLPVDAFVVGLGMLAAALDWVRGRRY